VTKCFGDDILYLQKARQPNQPDYSGDESRRLAAVE
jgi:hypothetical protein